VSIFRKTWGTPRASSVALILVLAVWLYVQKIDTTPPPVIDQILVLTFGGWFTQLMIEKKADEKKAEEKAEKKAEKKAKEKLKGEADTEK